MTLDSLNLGHRARNCVALVGAGTAEELAEWGGDPLKWPKSGMATVVQITRALLKVGLTPVWLRTFAPKIDYNDATVEAGVGPEWREVAGPFSLPKESAMLERFIADLERGAVAWQLAPFDGGPGLMLYRSGGKVLVKEGL